MVVNPFPLDAAMLAALAVSLSPERFQTYLDAASGDAARAIRLYTWNTAASAAFYGPLQGLEVALRNALHRELTATYGAAGTPWYDNPACGLDRKALSRIDEAKNNLARKGYAIDAPHVVAALSFGFWVSLLGRGRAGRGTQGPKPNYEMTLWRPCLHRAFPHGRFKRAQIQKPLDHLLEFRNRIAHHEPIFTRHLEKDYQSILTVTGWICPNTRDWIAHHARVLDILQLPQEDERTRF